MSKRCKVCGQPIDCGIVLHRDCYNRLKNRWISTEDRLPPNEDMVLVIVNGKYKNIVFENAMEMATYVEEGGWIIKWLPEWEDAQVSHWTPLPYQPADL